jgi:hypothetical protein
VYLSVAVHLTVVLMDTTRSDHPQVGPRDESAPFVVDLLLRLDLHFCGNNQICGERSSRDGPCGQNAATECWQMTFSER